MTEPSADSRTPYDVLAALVNRRCSSAAKVGPLNQRTPADHHLKACEVRDRELVVGDAVVQGTRQTAMLVNGSVAGIDMAAQHQVVMLLEERPPVTAELAQRRIC